MKERLLVVICILVSLDIAIELISVFRATTTPQREVVRMAPPQTVVDVSNHPILGKGDTSTVLVEFSDFECPFCKRHATGVLKQIEEGLIMTGKVKYVFLHNPLTVHPNARVLAAGAMCVGGERFWDMHDALFEKAGTSKEELAQLAVGFGIDRIRFDSCINDPGTDKLVSTDSTTARNLGLSSTPSFALGVLNGQGKVVVKEFLIGAQPFEVFRKEILRVHG